MPIPPPIDPRQLAAEIESSVSEFNRLAALAASMQIQVQAEIGEQRMGGELVRPVLRVQVIAPL
jgi:hypothetical protein